MLLVAVCAAMFFPVWSEVYGDVNGDGRVDVEDVNEVVNVILGLPHGGQSGTQTFTVNGVSFTMVGVQGGTFTMGATSEQGSDVAKPAHQVTLSGYSIGQTEVTQALWVAVMGSNPSFHNQYGNSAYGSDQSWIDFATNLQRPVESVSWDDCQSFIVKLNQLTGQNFRLPTEAEWEYAARGGNKSLGFEYAGSNEIMDVAWWDSNSSLEFGDFIETVPHTVATKQPNELGLYDMTGNVWEWCQDWFGDYSSGAQVNPTGPASGLRRVYRGGGFCDWPPVCSVSFRLSDTPSRRSFKLGLRLAL